MRPLTVMAPTAERSGESLNASGPRLRRNQVAAQLGGKKRVELHTLIVTSKWIGHMHDVPLPSTQEKRLSANPSIQVPEIISAGIDGNGVYYPVFSAIYGQASYDLKRPMHTCSQVLRTSCILNYKYTIKNK